MDLGLDGRGAFVAGASSGLGFAVALELAREGCNVVMCSRSSTRINDAAATIANETGAEVAGIPCDVTNEDEVRRAIDDAAGRLGTLNILVTNAGGPPSGSIDQLSADQWRAALELNFMSTVNMCRSALPHLREAAGSSDALARILMITSISAKQPIPNLALSNAARAGVQGFAKSLAEEVGPEGITVNTILPGYTRTDRLTELAEGIREKTGQSIPEIEAGWADHSVLKRIAETEEFAAAAVFLLSKRASYVSGVALPVDGGRSKHLL